MEMRYDLEDMRTNYDERLYHDIDEECFDELLEEEEMLDCAHCAFMNEINKQIEWTQEELDDIF